MGKRFSPSRERFRELSKYFKDLPWELWNELLNSIVFVEEIGGQFERVDGFEDGQMKGSIPVSTAFGIEVRNTSDWSKLELSVEGDRIVITLKEYGG